ncbi:late embryogenesis abundant protein D-34-like [Durio zibethinus]|uniref:Late embryogenesis abundant protein D-34-like n=1 Tax=Durio zibethinus TaxID=66656 RepID=A0A6P5XI60_DURZI|nr:late embryogenesis abundant protein D-34-like [Durio zibethinus]
MKDRAHSSFHASLLLMSHAHLKDCGGRLPSVGPLLAWIMRPSHCGSISLFLMPTFVISSHAVKNMTIRGSPVHQTAGSVLKEPYAPPSAATVFYPFPFQSIEHITYQVGNFVNVTGELASKPIEPEDDAAMQSAETLVLGQTRKKGTAAAMQSAATANERAGVVSHNDAGVAGDQGVTVIKSDADGEVWVPEAVGGQLIGQYIQPEVSAITIPATLFAPDPITIGEAFETAAFSAADKPVDQSDAAAIQAAEMRATRSNQILPGGIASEAQSAATRNSRTMLFENQATLSDVLSDATLMLPMDKAVTREDADKAVAAELRNNPDMTTTPGGVGAAMAAAARRNQNSTI